MSKLKLYEAAIKSYNANVRGKDVGDCVKRSISLAFNIPYRDIEKELHNAARTKRNYRDVPGSYRYPDVFNIVIQQHTNNKWESINSRITVNDFADEHTIGTFLLLCGEPSRSYSDHMVCVIDGTIWDSWDSRSDIVYQSLLVKEDSDTSISNELDIDSLMVRAQSTLSDMMHKAFTSTKEDTSYIEYADIIDVRKMNNYKFVVKLKVKFEGYHEYSKSAISELKFSEIPFVFSPKLTQEEAAESVAETCRTVGYRKIRELKLYVKSQREKLELSKNADVYIPRYMNAAEKSLYNWLPTEIKQHLKGIQIYHPGEYSNSVEVHITPLEWDDRSINDRVNFESYEVSDVKDMIKRYVNNHEIPFVDYTPSEKY